MKSNKDELRRRGFVDDSEVDACVSFTQDELFQKMNSTLASERTEAAIILRKKIDYNNSEYIKYLLDRLAIENALYTRLEICNTLASGNMHTALVMCDYLGQIGKNQHKTVGVPSKKKSFPLQRDIISRTLSRMDKSVFPVLLAQLAIRERDKVSELIDAVGYMAFYNGELATATNFKEIEKLYGQYKDDELILWKIALCCSAFPLPESQRLLDKIERVSTHLSIMEEIHRSMKFIESYL
ncbi:MAG: hypothetical protein LBV71_13965 [Prevotella sp.]|nr:hypothetical protein [Prevotella sp.]